VPVIINGLAPGPHKILIQFVNANHQAIDQRFVTLVMISKGIEPHYHP
jgi:hypothetical protein